MDKKTICAVILLLLVSIPSFSQGGHQINGADNIIPATKQSLNQIPYLKTSDVSGTILNYALIYPSGISYYIKGRLSIEHLDITMPDGKVFRYNYSSNNGFKCSSLPEGNINWIQINALEVEVSSASSLGKNIVLNHNNTPAIHLFGEPTSSDNYGEISYTELSAFADGKILDNNGNKVFSGTSQEIETILAKNISVNISCSGLSNMAYKNLKEKVNWIRDAYSKWQQQNQASTSTSTNNYSSRQNNQNYSNNNNTNSRTNIQNGSYTQNTNNRQQQVQNHNDALLAQGTAIYNSTQHLGNPFYNNSVQLWPDQNSAEIARKRAEQEAEDEWEWEERQRIRAEEDARLKLEEAERERKMQEERQRQRIEAEKKQAQAEADRKVRYANWERTTKSSFDEKLTAWKNEANSYINKDLRKYSFFNGAKLPHWINFYSEAVKKIVLSTTILPDDKTKLIQEIASKVYNYYDICTKFNFEGALENNTRQSINTVFLYAKSAYGYSPESNAYNYLINQSYTINPLPKEKITVVEKNMLDVLSALKDLYSNSSYVSTKFVDTPELFYKKEYQTVYGRYYNKKPTIGSNYSVSLPIKKGLPENHKQFLNEAIKTYSVAYKFNNTNSNTDIGLNMLGVSSFYEGKPQTSLAYFDAILEMFNISSTTDYINRVKLNLNHNHTTSRSPIWIDSKELNSIVYYTGSAALALHYSGYYEESFKLLEHTKNAVFKLEKNVGYPNSSVAGWSMFPEPKTAYIYWEYYSMMVESLYMQGKFDEALLTANAFIKEISNSFLTETLKPYSGAKKQTFLSRLYSTYPKITGNAIHVDHNVANSLVRAILHKCNILIKNRDLEEAKVAFEPINETLEIHDATLNYFGDYQELGLSIMKELNPKLFNKKYADIIPKKTIDYITPTETNEWEQKHKTQVETLQKQFETKNYFDALSIAMDLAYTIDYRGDVSSLYLKSMLLGSQAALYSGHYFEGIFLARLGQSFDEEYFNLLKPYLLANALIAGKADIRFEGMEKYEGADLMKARYSLERELTKYSGTKYGNSYGYVELIKIEKTLSSNQVDSPFLCHLYNAIRFGKEDAEAKEIKILEKEYGAFKAENEKFLEENKTKKDVVTTESGLQYIVLKEGTGNKPTLNSEVKVHYQGTLIDGTVFDSSLDRGEPSIFPLDKVIKGWAEGLQLMPVGSKYKFFIPQELAFGSVQSGKTIKPFSVLIFEVELLEIIK